MEDISDEPERVILAGCQRLQPEGICVREQNAAYRAPQALPHRGGGGGGSNVATVRV